MTVPESIYACCKLLTSLPCKTFSSNKKYIFPSGVSRSHSALFSQLRYPNLVPQEEMPNLYYLLLIVFWLLMHNYCLGSYTVQNPTVCNLYLADLHLLLRWMGHRPLITVRQSPLSWPFLPEFSISLLCLMSNLKVPKPGVLGLASLPCSLWVPAQVCFSECVADPSPSFPLDLFFCRFLVHSLPEILDANSVWPVDSQEQEFVLLSSPCLDLYESLGAGLKSSAPTCMSRMFSIQRDMQQLDT